MNKKIDLRQLITILLIIAIAIVISVPALAAQTKKLSDVPEGKWYTNAV